MILGGPGRRHSLERPRLIQIVERPSDSPTNILRIPLAVAACHTVAICTCLPVCRIEAYKAPHPHLTKHRTICDDD